MKNQLFLKILFISFFIFSCSEDEKSKINSQGEFRINNRDLNIESTGIANNAYVLLSNNTIYLAFTDGEISLINDEIYYNDNITNLVEFELDAVSSLESVIYEIPTISSVQDFDFNLPHINYYKIYADISVENGIIVPNTGASYSSKFQNPVPEYGEIEIIQDNSLFDIEYKLDYATLPQYRETNGFFSGEITIL